MESTGRRAKNPNYLSNKYGIEQPPKKINKKSTDEKESKEQNGNISTGIYFYCITVEILQNICEPNEIIQPTVQLDKISNSNKKTKEKTTKTKKKGFY